MPARSATCWRLAGGAGAALDSAEPPFSLLYVYGPAGIGKTSLLDVFADLAAEVGASVVRLDGRDLLPSPPAVLEALRGVLHVPDGDDAIVGLSDTGRLVVLLDTYERLGPLDDWLRSRLLPRLPATALTVVAGRARLGRTAVLAALRLWTSRHRQDELAGCLR